MLKKTDLLYFKIIVSFCFLFLSIHSMDDANAHNIAPESSGSQEARGSFTGTIVDNLTGETLLGANIILVNTSIGSATNANGEFFVRNVPAGEQTFVIRYLGYLEKKVNVVIRPNETETLDIRLQPDHLEGEEVVIYTQALGQARAIRQQLNSNTIVNVVSEARLRELPDANAAESIGRLPGISVIRSAGEGQKVAIRGLSPQYSSVTIDGNRVPGTDGDRSVDLSMISPEMLSGIEVYKSIRPDMDADAIGGSVNFKMGSVPEETLYRLNLESGYSTHISGIGNYKASFSGSSRFFDNNLGLMITGTAQRVDRSAHVMGSSYRILRDALPEEPHAPIAVTSLNLSDRQGRRERLGGGISIDYNLPNGRIFMNNVFNNQFRDEVRFQRSYNVDANRQTWRVQDTDRNIFTGSSSLAGEHRFPQLFEINWRISRSVTTNETLYDHSMSFMETSALNLSGQDTLLAKGPHVIPDMAYNRIENAFFSSLDNNEMEQRQEDYSASLDIEVPFHLETELLPVLGGYFKFGGKHYNSYRDRLSTGYSVFPWTIEQQLYEYSNNTFPWERDSGGRFLMMPFITDMDHSYAIVDGRYDIAFMPDVDLVNVMWDDYSHRYRTQLATRFNDYNATERLSAGYAMMELNIGSRLMLLPGVRYEHEHSDYTAKGGEFRVKEDEIGQREDDLDRFFSDTTATRNKGLWFPMVQGRYRVTHWFDIRAARTVSVSRPSFHNVSPRYRVNYDAGSISRGDTQIKPMTSTNYDLFLTFHHNRLGLFTLGGFIKEVENLIYTRSANIFDPEKKGLPDNTFLFRISEPVNNERTTDVHGFEIEWQSNLTHLPRPFNGLVVNANYSRFFSETQYYSFQIERTAQGFVGVDTFRVAPMVHQADHIANASLGYDIAGFSARISMQYQGATLRSVGSRPETDQYTDDYLRFDASIRQRFFGNMMSIFANFHNITNREDRTSQFTYDRPRSMEYHGAAFDIGMEFRF